MCKTLYRSLGRPFWCSWGSSSYWVDVGTCHPRHSWWFCQGRNNDRISGRIWWCWTECWISSNRWPLTKNMTVIWCHRYSSRCGHCWCLWDIAEHAHPTNWLWLLRVVAQHAHPVRGLALWWKSGYLIADWAASKAQHREYFVVSILLILKTSLNLAWN